MTDAVTESDASSKQQAGLGLQSAIPESEVQTSGVIKDAWFQWTGLAIAWGCDVARHAIGSSPSTSERLYTMLRKPVA